MPKPPPRKAHLPRRDDLPTIKSSTLRKAKLIDASMTSATIELGGVTRQVGLWHMLWNDRGASWSFFLCPTCSRRCSKLRLFDGRLVCRRCDGLLARCQSGMAPGTRHRGDKGLAIENLRRRSAPGNRYYSARNRLHLRRALIVARRERLEGWRK